MGTCKRPRSLFTAVAGAEGAAGAVGAGGVGVDVSCVIEAVAAAVACPEA